MICRASMNPCPAFHASSSPAFLNPCEGSGLLGYLIANPASQPLSAAMFEWFDFSYNSDSHGNEPEFEIADFRMHNSTDRKATLPRALLAAAWGLLGFLIFAAPFLLSHAFSRSASVLYFSFSFFCHQIPERSFILFGYPLAVCQRCLGLYAGLFLGALLGPHDYFHRSQAVRRRWILTAAFFLVLDALLPFIGLWTSSRLSRFSTGLFLGYLISLLLTRGVEEFLKGVPRRSLSIGTSHLKGGFS
jgi:uncharacterized membrane protein